MPSSGEETQNNREAGHEAHQRAAGDQKSPPIPARQTTVEPNTADPKKNHYFAQFSNWVSLLTLLFVAAYTVITFVQWRSNHIFNKKQMRAINAQLAEMRGSSRQTDQTIKILRDQAETAKSVYITDERPWVAVEPHVISDLTWDSNGDARVAVDFLSENTGKTPAINVEIHAEFIILKLDDPRPYQKLLCDPIRSRSSQMPGNFGDILFPAHPEHYPWNLPISHASAEEFNKWMSETFKTRTPDKLYFNPTLIGCVDYRFTFAEGHHQTGFIRNLLKDGRFGFYIGEGPVPKERLSLPRYPFLSIPPD
jgi:hypothetical protein